MHRRFDIHTEEAISAVSAYWDQVVEGTADPSVAKIDPDDAAVIELISAHDETPRASDEFAARLRRQLMHQTASNPAGIGSHTARTGPGSDRSTCDRSATSVPAFGHRRRTRLLALGSLALLALLTVVAGFSIWSGRSDDPAVLAPIQSVILDDGTVVQSLAVSRLPAGSVPDSPSYWIANFKFSLEPGEAWRDVASRCQLARQNVVGLVESGTLAMINAGPFQITRANGTVESIAAGERADLTAGDSWTYFAGRDETNVHKWNPGSDTMVAYQTDWSLDMSCETVPANPEWVWHQSINLLPFDPGRPLVVTIERALIDPGLPLSAETVSRLGLTENDTDVYRVVGVEAGSLRASLVTTADESSSPEEEVEWSTTLTPDGRATWSAQEQPRSSEGKEWQFRAGTDETLVMTSIAWSYGDAVEELDSREPAGTQST